MRLLLDSDVLVWVFRGGLNEETAAEIEGATEAVVSAASVWELGIKHAKGKLHLPDEFFSAVLDRGFEQLSIAMNHAVAAAGLPHLHADPFDRMLVAQAQKEGLVLATSDTALADYGIETLTVPRPKPA